jgi:hypothetical protein
MFSFTKTSDGITLFVNAKVYTVSSADSRFLTLWQAVKKSDLKEITNILENKTPLEKVVDKVNQAGLTVDQNGNLVYKGINFNNSLSKTIVDYYNDGAPFKYLLNFLDRLIENPLVKAMGNKELMASLGLSENQLDKFIDDFYAFISHGNLPITPEGNFLAYKVVDSTFWSKRGGSMKLLSGTVDDTGKILNAPGQYIRCERNEVDPNRAKDCSYGLHVGALTYSGPGGSYYNQGDKTVIVSVSPTDVIAVPLDYGRSKMRVSAYTVIQEYVAPLDNTAQNEDLTEVQKDKVEPILEVGVGTVTVSPDSLWLGDSVKFTYDGKVRYVTVSEVTKNSIHGSLISPEENSGAWRQFTKSKMLNVELINN